MSTNVLSVEVLTAFSSQSTGAVHDMAFLTIDLVLDGFTVLWRRYSKANRMIGGSGRSGRRGVDAEQKVCKGVSGHCRQSVFKRGQGWCKSLRFTYPREQEEDVRGAEIDFVSIHVQAFSR